MTDTKTKKFKIIPNTERVLCRFVNIAAQLRDKSNLLIPGQLKAGENLLCAQVVDGGSTKFKPNQIIYYSEYSASQLTDIMNIVRSGTKDPYTEMTKEDNKYILIAEDDIMAYEEEIDPNLKIELVNKDYAWQPKPYQQDVPVIHR